MFRLTIETVRYYINLTSKFNLNYKEKVFNKKEWLYTYRKILFFDIYHFKNEKIKNEFFIENDIKHCI